MIKWFQMLNKAVTLTDSCEAGPFAVLLGDQVFLKIFVGLFIFFFNLAFPQAD